MEYGSKRIGCLVVDSSGFINASDLHELADSIVTIPDVVEEIRDRETRARLGCLPYEIKFREPKPEDVKIVAAFSKKTGDYSSLSAVDLKLMALVYMMDIEAHKGDDSHINKEPVVKSVVNELDKKTKVDVSPVKLPGFFRPQSDKKTDENRDDQGEEDEDSWITPDNVAEMEEKMSNLKVEEEKCLVACLTADYSIQNVLIQMGLKVASVKGYIIRQTRQFVLRCHACFKITAQMDRKFCPKCGNLGTLKRVSVHVNEKGEKVIRINFKKPINIRGTRYSLPMPRGGKHSNDPVLFEDQRIPQNKASKLTVAERKALDCKAILSDPGYVVRDNPFAINDVYSKASLFARNQKLAHLERRRNPNQVPRPTGNKKRSK